jgi:hypothetical protein
VEAVLEFLGSNAALLTAILALLVSLRATYIAHQAHNLNLKNKADARRLLLSEKKRELLNELDKEHATLATLSFVTEQQIAKFEECSRLNDLMPEELARLTSNLQTLETLKQSYFTQRAEIESLGDGADIAEQDERLANIRRLTIHLEKDIAHEKALLEQLRALAASAPIG